MISIFWNDEDEVGPANVNITEENIQYHSFPQSVTYIFSIETTINDGSTTLEAVSVIVGHE